MKGLNMTDPLQDPRFPGRPQHPDFWRISEIILQHDGDATEGGKGLDEIAAEVPVDPASLLYHARQRALRMLGGGAPTAMVTMWLDGFLAGARFGKQKG